MKIYSIVIQYNVYSSGRKRKAGFFSLDFSQCINLCKDVRNWVFCFFHTVDEKVMTIRSHTVCKFILHSLNVTGEGLK